MSIIMQYPKYLEYIAENIDETDFITDFNRDLLKKLNEVLSKNEEFNISYLADCYDSKQLGRVISIENRFTSSQNIEQVIDDCIKVIKEEKDKLGIVSPSDMNDEDFLNAIKNLGKNKKG